MSELEARAKILERLNKKKPARRIRVHFLVPREDGPVESGAAESNLPLSPSMRENMPSRFACACDPKLVMDGVIERGTDLPWHVYCLDCMATPIFEEKYREPQGPRSAEQRRATGGKDCGC